MKECSKCKIIKVLTEYHKRSNRPCGVRSMCKECYKKYPKHKKQRTDYMREYDYISAYGINLEFYNKMLVSQDFKCVICGGTAEEKMKGRKKFLCVDHCHKTGKVRGLLCDQCNRAIGLLKENPEFIKNALIYLTK